MEEQLINFKTAKLAKEKGFDIPVIYGYGKEDGSTYAKSYENTHCYNVRGLWSAPTQSLLQKWLREKHGIIISVDVSEEENYFYEITKLNPYEFLFCTGNFNTYELALEKALQEALNRTTL